MKTFAERIRYCVDKGRLTGADLSVWFGRPYPTVRTWREGSHEPWEPWRGEAERCLTALEALVRQNRLLPMPPSYNATERRAYVRQLVVQRDASLPKTRSA